MDQQQQQQQYVNMVKYETTRLKGQIKQFNLYEIILEPYFMINTWG